MEENFALGAQGRVDGAGDVSYHFDNGNICACCECGATSDTAVGDTPLGDAMVKGLCGILVALCGGDD